MARIVLVHGAFGGSWVWEPVLPALREAGHTVETLDLPGGGDDPTPIVEVSVAAYGERVVDAIRNTEPAVLVGHSMGGVAVTQAAARAPERVARLIYACAFAPGPGQSLGELVSWPEAAGDQVQANMVVDGDPPVGTMPPEASKTVLFNSCNGEWASWGAARLQPQAIAPFGQPVAVGDAEREAFERIPRAYILCSADRAIPPAMQRRMATERGCDPVIELDADHFPWLSAKDGFVAAIDRLASGMRS
jgi:pimeloyl-ACP methyl ester carboxylesterase